MILEAVLKMRAVAIVFICYALAVNADLDPNQRIVGGQVTTIDRYPSMCAVLFSTNLVTYNQNCGGSILNSRSILTAAHCLLGSSPVQTRIRVGSTWANSGGVVHSANSYIIHPNYNFPASVDFDIAIVRTASTISFNNNVQRASIAGSNYNLGDNQVVWATGWGRIYTGGPASEQLRHVQIWSINQAICRQRVGVLTDNMLCAGWLDVGGRGQCNQDSGGPLYHNMVVVGVCSFSGLICGDGFIPSVNVRVSRFTSWIQNNA